MAVSNTSAFSGPYIIGSAYYDTELSLFSHTRESGVPKATSPGITDMDDNGNLLYDYLQRPFDLAIDLQSVAKSTRMMDAGQQLGFPDKLYNALVAANACVRDLPVPEIGCPTLSVISPFQKKYLCVEENNHIQPFVNHMGATMDLRLANELALQRFQDAAFKHFPKLTEGMYSYDVKATWVKAKGDIRGVARLAWWVDDFGCVTLSAAMPGTDHQVDIRVTAEYLAQGVHRTTTHGGMVSINAAI